ncbi:hypothetical protein OIU83_21600 [Flavobacterium sp. LS1R49]|uniref:Uncharacterized protein n=1 Tax=Flavobacterium shii TaxID=2987687 RepID=A0A9X3C851_9FLAO|nr:hypothetical protein [Flavobacterium shii]MCV9930268.1 hypothetical protein [Flavobacterium shii]
MKKRKEFIFDNVITFHPAWMIPISIPCIIFYASIYYFLFGEFFRLPIILIFTGLYMGTGIMILKMLSMKITLWFDDYYLYMRKGKNNPQKYLKNDIIGFYSYNYETLTPQLLNSKIYMQFYLKNKKKIYFYDVEYRSRYENKKGRELRKFLIIAQQELGFSKINKKRFQNIYWYSTK